MCGVEAARSFSTSISDTYWCSPRAHASGVMRTRALATCVMAELCALYGMCSKADMYATHETCMDLSITMYLRPSLATADSPRMVNVFSSLRPAKLRSSRGMYTVGRVGARIDRCWSGTRIVLQKTPGRALATGRGSRMPARAFDHRRSTRSLRARQLGPHCTFPGSIEALLARETRRR